MYELDSDATSVTVIDLTSPDSTKGKKAEKGPRLLKLTQMKLFFAPKKTVGLPVVKKLVNPYLVKKTPRLPQFSVAAVPAPAADRVSLPGFVDVDAAPAKYQQQMAAAGKEVAHKKKSAAKFATNRSVANYFVDPACDLYSNKQPAVGKVRDSVKKKLKDLSLVNTLIYVNEVGNVPGSEGLVGVKQAPGRKKVKAANAGSNNDEDLMKQHRSKINKGLEKAYEIAFAEGKENFVRVIKAAKPPMSMHPTDALMVHRNKCTHAAKVAAEEIADLVGAWLLRAINGGFTPYKGKGTIDLENLKHRACTKALTMRDLTSILENKDKILEALLNQRAHFVGDRNN